MQLNVIGKHKEDVWDPKGLIFETVNTVKKHQDLLACLISLRSTT